MATIAPTGHMYRLTTGVVQMLICGTTTVIQGEMDHITILHTPTIRLLNFQKERKRLLLAKRPESLNWPVKPYS